MKQINMIIQYMGIMEGNIKVNEEEYSLREALIDNKITMEEIIAKADKDVEEKNINRNEYQEGGSTGAKDFINTIIIL